MKILKISLAALLVLPITSCGIYRRPIIEDDYLFYRILRVGNEFYEKLPWVISRNCETLAKRVLAASAERSAKEGGQLIEYTNLVQISKTNQSIICKGYFQGNGVWRSDTYIISQDKDGVYWRTPGRIEYQIQQEIQIPQQQIEIQLQEVE